MSKNLKYLIELEEEELEQEELPKIQRIKKKPKYADEPKQQKDTEN